MSRTTSGGMMNLLNLNPIIARRSKAKLNDISGDLNDDDGWTSQNEDDDDDDE